MAVEKTNTSISQALTQKYGGASAAQAQGQVDLLTKQRAELQSQLDAIAPQIDQYGNAQQLTQEQMKQRDLLMQQRQQLDANLRSQQSLVSNPLAGVDAKQRDIIKGAQFGEAVLGEGGLGRAADNADIQAGMAALREQAQGFSSGEALARREQAVEGLNTAQEGQRRRLQAQLARAGVRGGVAGNQLLQQSADAMSQRSNLERDLFLAGEDARRTGTQNLLTGAGELQRFDLSQAAAEKNIVLQSGLGFAQLGAAERGAQLQADASKAQAAAQANACHIAGTLVKMADGTYKKIEDIKVGDELHVGGKVKIRGEAEADDDIYEFNGEFVTGSHVIYSELKDKYICVKNLKAKKTNMPSTTIVYPLLTENGCYVTKSGAIHGDLLTEDNQEGISFRVKRASEIG